MIRPFVYLACPYSDPDPAVREARFHAANAAAGKLIHRGALVFSPISHTHPIVMAHGGLPLDWTFWERYDRAMLDHCYRIAVLKLPGWRESVGVQAEMQIAAEMGLPFEFLEPLP